MKQTGLKYAGIFLLTAAVVVPVVWLMLRSKVDSVPENHAPQQNIENESDFARPDSFLRNPPPIDEYHTAPLESDHADVPMPVMPVPTKDTSIFEINQDVFIPKDDILVDEPALEKEYFPEVEAEMLPVEKREGDLPPPAVVEAFVPELPDPAANRMISTAIRFVNSSPNDFEGDLRVKTPRGVRSVSGESIALRVGAGDTLFVPMVFMSGGLVPAGDNTIEFTLKDSYEREVKKTTASLAVTEKINLQLTLDQPLLLISNLTDSLALNARVTNHGNTDQWVTVVMAFPVMRGGKVFREVQGWVPAGRDTLLALKVWPREILWNETVTFVNMTGLRGEDKQVFGSANLAMQSVVSSGRYLSNETDNFLLYDNQYIPQEISLSYRHLGRNAMYQAMGGGHIDLPAGSLSLQGLIYKSAAQNEITALNTVATYRYDNHSLSLGNINEPMEYSSFGRGVKVVLSDKNSKNTLKLGFVDNQFNLLSSRPLFENGYTFFAKDQIGADRAVGLNYLFRDDRWEQARHHIAGGEWKLERNRNWNFLMRSHLGVSDYRNRNALVPSGSAEFQYSGQQKSSTFSGNIYYSTAYFPGNRRGTVNLQQNFNRQLKRGSSIRANAFYANFAPRSYHYEMDVQNANYRAEGVYTFPTSGSTSFGLGYQHQTETGNLSYLGGTDILYSRALTHAHRLVEYLNWRGGKHGFYLGIENGLVRNFYSKEWKPQGRANLFYNWGRLSLNSTYQYGGYFLGEQNFARQAGKTTQRLLASASWNKELDNFTLSAGANYSKDFAVGSSYSASLNSRYRINHRYSVFFSSVAYNYSFDSKISVQDYSQTMYNLEGGVTLNLNQAIPATGKKSKVTIQVFHDKNGNQQRDPDEDFAVDYMIMMGNKLFMTDDNGHINYAGLPFGNYTIKAGAHAGWFHRETAFVVNGFKEKIEIPLRQAGSVRGSITYRYDERIAKEFVAQTIALKIMKNGEPVQRVVTDNDGNFLVFLPTDEYSIEVESGGMDENTTVINPIQHFSIESGKIATLEPFVFQVRNKKINIRQFVQNAP